MANKTLVKTSDKTYNNKTIKIPLSSPIIILDEKQQQVVNSQQFDFGCVH